MTSSLNFINGNGSFNVAAIMSAAHRKARHETNKSLCFAAGIGPANLTGYGRHFEAAYAETAASIDRRTVKLSPRFGYRAHLAKALAEYWFQARVMRQHHVPAAAVTDVVRMQLALSAIASGLESIRRGRTGVAVAAIQDGYDSLCVTTAKSVAGLTARPAS